MEKIKIVLVDDDLTSRNTIKKYLEGNLLYDISADFSNGKSALEWLRKNRIDILLCDMQMPEMNGVELMRNIHIIDAYLPIIAISSFDDFKYVRGSLVNGAANYLLKHELTKKQLIYVLDQVREQYRIIPEGKQIMFKSGHCIYHEEEFSEAEIRRLSNSGQINFCCRNIAAVAIEPDYKYVEGVKSAEYKQDISNAVIDLLKQILGEKYQYLIYITQKHQLLVLISFAKECSTLFILNTLTNLAQRMQRQIIRMLDMTVTIITGELHQELGKALNEANHMLELLEDKLYLGGNRIVPVVAAKKMKYSNKALPNRLWSQLVYELEHKMPDCLNTMQKLLEFMEKEHYSLEYVRKSCNQLLLAMQSAGLLETEQVKNLEEHMKVYEQFQQFKNEMVELLNKQLLQDRQSKYKPYSHQIVRVLEYIDQNYAKDISLEKCAQLTGSSYTHLSKAFKKETGMRFVEYLNRMRVNKAESLLIGKQGTLKEIAEESGFRNYNYFFKVFKEIVGITPSEFQTKK